MLVSFLPEYDKDVSIIPAIFLNFKLQGSVVIPFMTTLSEHDPYLPITEKMLLAVVESPGPSERHRRLVVELLL